MKNYIPLHVHSHYSLLDGLSKPKQIARRCKKIGVKSCAITDHGSISGAVQIHQTLKSSGIKPILGCELYLSFDDSSIKTPENSKLTHFLVLAKNLEGWKNLIRIVSESNNPNNYYRKPRLSVNKLQEIVKGKNLIAFCGHMGSYIPDIIANNPDNYQKPCLNFVDQMKDIFGKDNFFLETQLMDQEYMPKQLELTETIRKIASITKTKVICTPDAHYSEQEDATDQRILLCNNIKTTLTDINKKMLDGQDVPFSCFFKSDKYYILSPEEMAELHTEEEIENTQLIDSMCEEYDILHKPVLPPFKCPNGQNPDEYLRQLCRNGWRDKIANVVPKDQHSSYTERIKQELSVLQGADLSSYF